MPLRFLSDLAGTFNAFFRIGSIRLKNSSGVLEARNADDTTTGALRASTVGVALDNTANRVDIGLNGTPSGAIAFNLPVVTGTTGQVLQTNGAGALSWASVATASGQVLAEQTALAFGSGASVVCFTPPANCVIRTVIVDVDTAFNGTAPTVSVGVSGFLTRYMGANENDLKTAGTYETAPMYQEDGTPEQIILTYAASTSSAGSATVIIEYSNPA